MPNLVLYDKTKRGWICCEDFQGISRTIGDHVYFSIEATEPNRLDFETVEVLPLKIEMLDCSNKALIKMYLRRMLDLTNCTPQVPIMMSDFEDRSDPPTKAQEEVEALMTEGFGSQPSLSDQTPVDNLPILGFS